MAAEENIASGVTFKPQATATPIAEPTTGDLDEIIAVNSFMNDSPGIFDIWLSTSPMINDANRPRAIALKAPKRYLLTPFFITTLNFSMRFPPIKI